MEGAFSLVLVAMSEGQWELVGLWWRDEIAQSQANLQRLLRAALSHLHTLVQAQKKLEAS